MAPSRVEPPPKHVITYAAVVGKIIERHRAALGVKQTDMAKALGIGQPAYSRLETGENAMGLGQLEVVARRLSSTPNRILQEADFWVARLKEQGVEVRNDRDLGAALLIGVGILLALIAAAGK